MAEIKPSKALLAPIDPASCSLAESNYHYSALNNQINEIRIAKIFPATDATTPISCSLSHVPLDTAPPFKALSYTWGLATECRSISIDGKPALVTTNLELALQRIRSKNDIVFMWIDSISINQRDLDERSAQAAKMKQIYQRANAVYVWLGKADHDSATAWKFVLDLIKRSTTSVTEIFQDRHNLGSFQALNRLFMRPYWRRIWVIQEVTCAKYVTVYCGEESMSWKELESVCDILRSVKNHLIESIYPDDPTSVSNLLIGGPKCLKLSGFLTEEKLPSLLDLLYTHKGKHATDSRDKVYALVGISASQHTFGKVDYARSLVDTYCYTAKHIITISGKLDVICVRESDDNIYGLPSWVPDWERRNEAPKHRVMGLHLRTPRFKAAGDSFAISNFSNDGSILTTKGYAIDTVKAVGKPLQLVGAHDADEKISQTLDVFESWWNAFASIKGTDIAAQNEFQRSMRGGAWTADNELDSSKTFALFCQCFQTLSLSKKLATPSFPIFTSFNTENEQRTTVATVSLRMHAKRLAISSESLFTCLAPCDTEQGDIICILLGCSFPVILRPHDECYVLIGEVYVDGIMYGEMMNELEMGKYQLVDFNIQ